jgi:hypothetical protein
VASNDKRRRRGDRIPRAEVTESSQLNSPDRVGAFLQEVKAGAAPLTGIVAISAEIPAPTTPSGVTVATVPFLTTPLIPWSKVTTGDPLPRLVQLLQDRGGLWLARRTAAVVEWTVGPTREPPGSPSASDAPDEEPRPEAWIRVDFTFSGAWNGKFALAGPAGGLSDNLWCVAASPLIGVLPEEVLDRALPTQPVEHPVTWDEFTRSLVNTLHTTTNTSEAVRRLVVASGWPGTDRLTR